jgi:hypothetical protein
MVRLTEVERAMRLSQKEIKKIESRPNLWKFMKSYGLDQGKQYKNLKSQDMMNEINKHKDIKLKYLFTQMNTYEMSPSTVNNFADRVIESSDDDEVYAVEMYDNDNLVKTITLSRNIDPLVIKLICKKSITEAINMIDGDEYSYKAELTAIYNNMNINRLKIVKVTADRNLTSRSGAYINRINKTNFDLSRYGLFTEQYYRELIEFNDGRTSEMNRRYVPQCLIHVLELSNIDSNLINNVKLFLGSYYVRRTQLPEITKIIKHNIKIHSFRKTAGRENEVDSKLIKAGTDMEYPTINIAIYNDHYFIFENVNIEGFPYPIGRNRQQLKTSLHVVRDMINNDNLTQLIPFEIICATEDFHQFNYELEFNNNTILSSSKYPCFEEQTKRNRNIYYIDFEASTKSPDNTVINHVPFMVSLSSNKDTHNVIHNFTGVDCALQMLQYIQNDCKHSKADIVIYAHNAKYDFSFIQHHVKIIQFVEKNNQFYSASCIFGSTSFSMYDSYKILTMKLADFGTNFDIKNIQKEIMPYEAYNVYRDGITLEDRISIDTLRSIYDDKYCNDLFIHAKDYIDENGLKSLEYARFYCNQDVMILRKGIEAFAEIMEDILGLDIYNYITISSIANAYMEKSHVYDDTYKVTTAARLFLERCIVGGIVATKHNEIQIELDTEIEAADANSLYPSAMVELCKQGYGIPKGEPKIYNCDLFNDNIYTSIPDELNRYSYFFVEIEVLYVKDNKYDIDVFSYKKDGKRINTYRIDEPITINVDKITLLDYINYHQIQFKIKNCIYYNDGFNTKIGEKVSELFERRKLAKDAGKKGIANCIKLIMNSIYGRTILSHNKTSIQYKYDDEVSSYMFNNHNIIKNITKINDRCTKFEIYVPNDHYNLAAAGVMILSMSKHMMNRASLACMNVGVSIYYKDTDSLHIKKKNIKAINDEYKRLYNVDMFGGELGQFSSDFEMKVKCTDIVCIDAVYIAKKVYYERLKGIDKDGNNVIQHDCVIKGINRAAIDKVVNEKYNGDYLGLFIDLTKGKQITFDLSSTRPCFKHLKDGTIITNLDFTRTLQFKKNDRNEFYIIQHCE